MTYLVALAILHDACYAHGVVTVAQHAGVT